MRAILKTSIATTALVLFIGVGGALAESSGPSSTPPAECHGSYNPYDYTAEALEACDIPVYPATVTKIPDGGQRYSYYKPDGALYAKTMMPPEGFDPKSASDEELAEYGYPPRPAAPLPPQQEEWERMVSIPRTTPEPFMVDVTSFTASLTNSHWSGRITNEGGFTYAESDYTEPSFDNSVCGPSADPDLSKFGRLVLNSNKAAQEGFGLYLTEFPNEGIFMFNGATELASPTTVGAQGLFEVAWQHC